MTFFRRMRPLDIAVLVLLLAVLAVGGALGFSVYRQKSGAKSSAPVSRAIRNLEGQVRRSPNDVNLRMQLAQAYAVAGQDRDAESQYEQVLKAKKDYLPAVSGIAFLASRSQQWEKSEKLWMKVVALCGEQPAGLASKQYETACFYLGTALLEQKKYSRAISYFKESLRVNNTAADTHFLLANAYQGIGALDEYRAELEYALAFDPTMPDANYQYGEVLLKANDIAGAAQHFRVSVDNAPDRLEPRKALDKLGPVSVRIDNARSALTKDPARAVVEARVAVALAPDSVEALLILGNAYEKTNKKSAAADAYRKVLSYDAGNADAKAGLERVSKSER